jgi:hypothetical protein
MILVRARAEREMVLFLPLDGAVGEIPGAALMNSNMLFRRVGIP